jgi:sulfur carrier protein
MVISINNEEKTVSSHFLSSILIELNFSELQGIAVAVNQEVISQLEWETYSLYEKDEIILIQATQGG